VAANPGVDANMPAATVTVNWGLRAALLPLLLVVASLALLWRGRRARLDLWLMLALVVCAVGLLMRALVNDGTSSAWHFARLFDLLGVGGLMFALLGENASMYSRLTRLLAGRQVADGRERRGVDTADVVNGIADELNQPLCAITANADAIGRLLEKERPDMAEVRAALDDIVGDARRASEALRDSQRMLKSASEAPAVIDVGQLVCECLSQLRPELSSRRVTCEAITADRLPGVHGSRPQLLQVLVDLVRHALESWPGAQPRDRRLRLRASRHEAGAVAIWVEASGGAGIPPPSHPRLAFCRTVVTAHGGHFSVTPDAQGGAAFKVILPASS
jgi:signal transduction histidine kinase